MKTNRSRDAPIWAMNPFRFFSSTPWSCRPKSCTSAFDFASAYVDHHQHVKIVGFCEMLEMMQARTVVREERAQVGGVELAFGAVRPEDDREVVAQVVRARSDHRVLAARLSTHWTRV